MGGVRDHFVVSTLEGFKGIAHFVSEPVVPPTISTLSKNERLHSDLRWYESEQYPQYLLQIVSVDSIAALLYLEL